MPKPAGQPPDIDAEERILDAAHAVFMRRGTAGARMQEIADEAGVNKALLHYYFRSKDRLAAAVFQRAATRIFPNVLRILASDVELQEKVRQVVEYYIDQLSLTPYLAGYVICELNQHPDRITQMFRAVSAGAGGDAGAKPLHMRVRETLEKQLRAKARAGELRPIAHEQFLVNLLSVCVFPFAARPMLEAMLELDEAAFRRFMAQRRKQLPDFFLRALQP